LVSPASLARSTLAASLAMHFWVLIERGLLLPLPSA